MIMNSGKMLGRGDVEIVNDDGFLEKCSGN